MGRIQDMIAVVTGASQGLGEAIVRRFAEEGAFVVMTDVNEELGTKVADELGERVIFVKHDVSSKAEWEAVFAFVDETYGKLDILVNNAGIAPLESFETMPEEKYMNIIDVNQRSVFLSTQMAKPLLDKAGGGSIVNLSSISGMVGTIGGAGYNSSKYAVRGLTRVAALEFAKDNIRVNSIHLGTIDTPILAVLDDEYRAAVDASIPMGRVGKPVEIANLALFLASDESTYCTGAEFVADGGYTIQ